MFRHFRPFGSAEYVRMVDGVISVFGGFDTICYYSNVDLIVELADSAGVDAISSTIVAQSANVPTLGWSGDGLVTDARNADGMIDVPEDLYLKACVTDVEQAIEVADCVGYPLKIKASEGGGGKGIRKVTDPSQFRAAFAQVAAEVQGSHIFLMRLASNARQLEVRILADAYGNAISLFGRNCSAQRRHQKILEGAPVTIADPAISEDMEMSAVLLAKLVGYVNAGTAEFLYDVDSNKYYFLERNPRPQVEHSTTEMVFGVNISAAQLQVAMDIPLHRISPVCMLYGLQPHTTSEIDFHFDNPQSLTIQRKPAPTGHVIACRITAENPDAGFKPSGGHLVELNFRSSTDFGHVFAYFHDRHPLRRNMIMTPKELRIRGDFRTNVEYLITLLETDEFANNHFSTEWLDARIQQKLTAERHDRWVSVVTGAATMVFLAAEDQKAQFLKSLDKSQVPTLAGINDEFSTSFIFDGVRYDIAPTRMSINGRTVVLEQEADPTQLRSPSPSPGKLVRWLIPNAGHVDTGQAFAEIGVMKMIMPLVTTDAGTFAPGRKQPGSPIAAGEILAVLELDGMSQVKTAEVSVEPFPSSIASSTWSASLERGRNARFAAVLLSAATATAAPLASAVVVLRYLDLQQVLDLAVDGFKQVQPVASLLAAYLDVIHRPELPFLHTAQVLGSYHGRLPNGLEGKLLDLNSTASTETTPFPAAEQPRSSPRYEAGADAHAVDGSTCSTVLKLRTRMELEAQYWTCFSRSRAAWKGKAIGVVLDLVAAQRSVLARSPNVQKQHTALHQLAELGGTAAVSVAAKAKGAPLPGFDERYRQFRDVARAVAGLPEASPAAREEALNLINSPFSIFDVLPSLFYEHDVPAVDRLIALDMYVRRAYNTYRVHAVKKRDAFLVSLVEWQFQVSAHDLGIGNASTAAAGGSAYDNLRAASVSNVTLMVKRVELGPVRVGIMAAVCDAAELQLHLPGILALFPQVQAKKLGRTEPWHVLNVAIEVPAANTWDDEADGAETDAALSSLFGSLLTLSTAALRSRGIRRVTMVVYRKGQYPRYFTYGERLAFGEDATIRNIEPIHVCHAVGKDNALNSRFFLRALVRPGGPTPSVGERWTVEYPTADSNGILIDTLNELELAAERFPNTDYNHLFLSFLPELPVSPNEVQDSFAGFLMRYGKRLWKLHITSAEVRFLCHLPTTGAETTTCRFSVSNLSGVIKAERHREVKDDRGRVVLHTEGTSSASGKGEHHLAPADWAYPNKEKVQPRRHRAHVMGTTYIYDYLDLVHEALAQQWARYPHLARPAGNLVDAVELVLGKDGALCKVARPIGSNTCGMVAWLVEMRTPECPRSRFMVLIANDITFAIGSFGPQEDDVFAAASKLARELGVLRIYVSANSSVRIGLADEVLAAYRIAWDYVRLRDSVTVERLVDDDTGETHMRIVDVIGIKDGLGVKNLMGSGLIAGEASAAYDEIFTATLVACRSVGIGASLVRLGQRAIQCDGQPIILTGAAALNKVIGRDVYSSNLQLGGVQIVIGNGISHLTSIDPLHGVAQIIQWLSYVPAHRGAPLPILQAPISNPAAIAAAHPASAFSTTASSVADGAAGDAASYQFDEADRDIDFAPTRSLHDQRRMLHGHRDESGAWVGGFFDRGSWMETMDGWSKTVVVGRGRLGGVPVGAIAVETRTVEAVIPADPANPDSAETIVEPPGVWTPASAYKTAQAIRDLGREALPLLTFANWRGFSGGQRDMFDTILKFGSYIVDALRTYRA
ncbi:acetyl-coenzyme-A carboxylase [Blastocladiella emersonii ATCC 22665]|nr:acetyl-coenzyme-A carboxylase [Blastocladiella emersonii ATCC 22665]